MLRLVMQARDLQSFTAVGYTVGRVTPFDLFPQTRHLEVVIVLSRGSQLGAGDQKRGSILSEAQMQLRDGLRLQFDCAHEIVFNARMTIITYMEGL